MGRLQSITGDLGAPSYEGGQALTNALTQDTSTKRTGAGSYKCVVSSASTMYGCRWRFIASTSGVFYARTYLYIDTLPNYNCSIFGFSQEGTPVNRHHIVLRSNGKLALYFGAGQVGSDSDTLDVDTWYMIDVHSDNTQGDGACVIEGRLNGSVFATASNKNAQLTGDLWVGGNLHTSFDDSTTGTWYFDDIAINDDGGSDQNSYPGEGALWVGRPNAAGYIEQGESGPTTGQDAHDVTDETPPNDATDYWEFEGNNDELLMNIDSPSGVIASGDTINSVEVWARLRGEESLTCKLGPGIRAGSTSQYGTEQNIYTVTWSTNGEYMTAQRSFPWYVTETNPDDAAAFEYSDIDSLQIGGKGVDSNPDIWVTAFWVVVDFTASAGQDRTFAADLQATAALTIDVDLDREIVADLQATADLTAFAQIDREIVADLSATADFTAALSIDRNVVVDLQSTADLGAIAEIDRGIAADLQATADLGVLTEVDREIVADLQATADLAANIETGGEVTFAANLVSTADFGAVANIDREIVADLSATADLTIDTEIDREIVADLQATADLAANIEIAGTVTFAADLQATADFGAIANIDREIAVDLQSTSDLGAIVAVERELAVNLQATADHNAAFSVDRNLVVDLQATSDMNAVADIDRGVDVSLVALATLAVNANMDREIVADLQSTADLTIALSTEEFLALIAERTAKMHLRRERASSMHLARERTINF